MLNKSRRIKLNRDFERIFSQGKTINGGFFKVRFLKNNLVFSRFAVVISSKVSKKSVIRNKIRRRVWSVLAKNSHSLPKNLDVVFIALNQAGQIDFAKTQEEITYLLRKFV